VLRRWLLRKLLPLLRLLLLKALLHLPLALRLPLLLPPLARRKRRLRRRTKNSLHLSSYTTIIPRLWRGIFFAGIFYLHNVKPVTMTCPNCQKKSEDTAILCTECGYPFAGSPESKAKFIADQVTKSGDIVDSKDHLKNASYILYVVGAIFIVQGFFTNDVITIAIACFLGVVFILFGIFLKWSPVLMMSVPLGILVLIYGLAAIDDPAILSRFIWLKATVVVGLIYGIRSAVLAERYRKQSSYLSKQ
jgi:hypothetical protein